MASAWSRRSAELADFTMLHLVNRRDVWGGYLPRHRRTVDQHGVEQKIYTAPAKRDRGARHLNGDVLARHFRGASEGHVIGLHATSADNMSRWLGFDFDNHEGAEARAEQNHAQCADLVDALRLFGLTPLVEDSDGRGGLHVWNIFSEPVETLRVHAFGSAVVRELAINAEIYPKQPKLQTGRFGNWLRLPGRHHSHPHWSRVLASGEWLEDEDAVELLLCAWTSPADELPIPKPAPLPAPYLPRHAIGPVEHRVRGYMAKLPTALAAGDGRNHAGYLFACFMVNDLAVSNADALGWLAEWNAAHRTPMSDAKLRDLIGDAHRYGKHARGSAA